MKKFFKEFKKFALKGNVVDLAVGVIIGAAFKAIVDSLVGDIISPLIGLIANTDFSYLTIRVGEVDIRYGAFITAILNFIILALVIFFIVRSINRLSDRAAKKKAPAPATTKKCPFCCTEISIDATRCPHCTSELPEEKK